MCITGRMRNELKAKILKEVIDEVMPDIGRLIYLSTSYVIHIYLINIYLTIYLSEGCYDLDDMLTNGGVKHRGPIVSFFKYFGCWPLTIHETVLSGINQCIYL
jgi:hypothetical protein